MSLCARGAAAAALGMRRVRETAGQGENGFEVLRAWLQPCFEGDQTQPHTWPGRGFTTAQLGSRSTAAAEDMSCTSITTDVTEKQFCFLGFFFDACDV